MADNECTNDEDDFACPLSKKRRKNYDATKLFQEVRAVRLPWAKGVLNCNGSLHMVKCIPCCMFSSKPCILAPKWDTLVKYEGRRVAEKDMPKYNVKKGSPTWPKIANIAIIQPCMLQVLASLRQSWSR